MLRTSQDSLQLDELHRSSSQPQGKQAVSTAFTSKASVGQRMTTEVRDLRGQIDGLVRDSERKDHRIDALVKEIQSLRANNSNHQREIKLLNNMLDKLKQDKSGLQQDQSKAHASIAALQDKLKTLSESSKLLQQIDLQAHRQEELELEISSLQGELTLKQERITALEYELDVAHRAVHFQSRYEQQSSQNLATAVGSNREVLRSLYFDLGKRTAESHNMALTLAEMSDEMQQLKQDLQRAQDDNQQLAAEKTSWQQQRHNLTSHQQQSEQEVSGLQDKLHHKTEMQEKLQRQIEDLVKRLSETRLTHEEVVREKHFRITEQNSLITKLQQEKEDYLRQIDILQHQKASLDHAKQQAEDELQYEKDILLEEIQQLRNQVSAFDQLKKDQMALEKVMQSYQKDHEKTQDDAKMLQSEKAQLQAHLHYINFQLRKVMDDLANKDHSIQALQQLQEKTCSERDQVAEALRKAMHTTRELASKLKQEQALSRTFERQLQVLAEERANVSSAILDALHKERLKNAQLSASLEGKLLSTSSLLGHSMLPEDDVALFPAQQQQKRKLEEVRVSKDSHASSKSKSALDTSLTADNNNSTAGSSSSALFQVTPSVDRSQRGDFSWLNDDSHIQSVMQSVYSKSQSKADLPPPVKPVDDNSSNSNKLPAAEPYTTSFRETVVDELRKLSEEITLFEEKFPHAASSTTMPPPAQPAANLRSAVDKSRSNSESSTTSSKTDSLDLMPMLSSQESDRR